MANNQPKNNYSFNDNNISAGTNYYRIKQVDNDGSFSYSVQVKITIDANGINFSIMPNPASDHITLQVPDNISLLNITINDASGKAMYTNSNVQLMNAGNGYFTIELSNFVNGTYFIRVLTANGNLIEKLVVIK